MTKAVKAANSVPHHRKDRHIAEKVQRAISVLMVIAIAVLAVGFIYGIANTGAGTPSWMQ
jgi:hypothetical protein